MLHTTFLSYSRRDQEAVDDIAARLASARVPVWLDRRDLPISLPWLDEVRAAIEAADLVVVCDSPDWQRSEACRLEEDAARAAHKTIFRIDVRSTAPEVAAAAIVAAQRGTTARRWAHTEVTARAAIWDREGRSKGSLIGGALLRQARDVLRAGEPPLSSTTRQYIARSTGRQRRRRLMAAFAAALTVLTTLVLCLGAVLFGLVPNELERRETLVKPLTVDDGPIIQDPYEKIAAARAEILNGNDSWLFRTHLARTLAAKVPDVSYTVSDRLTAFAGTPRGDRATVVDRRGRVFDGPTGTPGPATKPPTTRPGPVTSRDGRRIAVPATDGGTVRVFARDGKQLTFLRAVAVAGPAGPAAFSPNGRLLAVASDAGVTLADLRTGLTIAELSGSVGVIRALAWSQDGARVWAVAGDNRVTGWRWRSGRIVIDEPARRFIAVAGPTNEGSLAVADQDGKISLVDAVTGRVRRTIATGTRQVSDAELSRDGRTIVLARAHDIVVHLVGRGLERTIPVGCRIFDLAVDETAERAYVACPSQGLRVFSLDSGTLLYSADIPVVEESSITLRAHGTVFVGDNVGQLHRFDRKLSGHRKLADGTCALPTRRVATDSAGRTVVFAGDAPGRHTCMYQMQMANGSWQRNLHQMPLSAGEKAHAIAVAPDDSSAVIGFSDGVVYLWRLDNLDPLALHHDFGGEVRGAAFTPDGRQVLVAGEDGMVELLPACTVCGSARDLAEQAGRVIDNATAAGLR